MVGTQHGWSTKDANQFNGAAVVRTLQGTMMSPLIAKPFVGVLRMMGMGPPPSGHNLTKDVFCSAFTVPSDAICAASDCMIQRESFFGDGSTLV